MKVAVIGAGAVGCYFGGLLARAGHDVLFIGRPTHVDAINARGLLLETKSFRTHVPARAAIDTAAVDGPDLVLFCVKSADTETAGRGLAERIAPHTSIISLQNGVDNAGRLAGVLGRPVVPAVVYVGTEMAGPGHVRHHGRGDLLIGAGHGSEALARDLTAAGIMTTATAEIASALWVKLIINCAYNPLSAIGSIAYGPMVKVAGALDVMTAVVNECVAVAAACGVRVPDDTLSKVLALAANMPDQLSSTAQDLARGKPTEIDYLNGYVVRKGAELGIATPINLALHVGVKVAEAGRATAAV
jgi:2-dehydropantoate 2-reductase